MDPRQLQGHPATGRPRHSGMTLLLMVMVFSIVTINHMMVNGAEEIRRAPVISCAPFGSSAVPSLVYATRRLTVPPLLSRPPAAANVAPSSPAPPACGGHAVMSMNKVCCGC